MSFGLGAISTMQILLQLLEYFFTGSVALIWAASALRLLGAPSNLGVLEPYVVIGLVYVIGMLVDGVGSFALRRWKFRIEEKVRDAHPLTHGLTRHEFHTAHVFAYAYAHATELARHLSLRSSRDRVARGALINAILIGAIPGGHYLIQGEAASSLKVTAVISWAAITVLSFAVWWRFQRSSARYEVLTYEVLVKEGKMERIKPPNPPAGPS